MKNKVNILGTIYEIKILNEKKDKKLNGCDGYCDRTVKLIVINDFEDFKNNENALNDMEWYKHKVCRHEIIHAFLAESGLNECSTNFPQWALNEEMVDWFAVQGTKIYKAWKEVGCLGGETE